MPIVFLLSYLSISCGHFTEISYVTCPATTINQTRIPPRDNQQPTTSYVRTRKKSTSNDLLGRPRVQVNVKDFTGNASITLFNNDAIEVIGVPLSKLQEVASVDGDLEEFNNILTSRIGKLYFIRVKITKDNQIYGANGSFTAISATPHTDGPLDPV